MFGNYVAYTVEWSNKTFLLYLLIVVLSYFLPKIKINLCFYPNGKKKVIPLGIALVGLILIVVKGFNASGVDVGTGYYYDFLSATSIENFRDSSVEKGYILLNVFIKNIFHEYWIFLFVVTLITVVPLLYVVNKYSNYVDTSITLFLYTAIFYFPSFSLIRIALAASIGLFALDSMYEKKMTKAFVWIIISTLFHRSMFCLLMPFVLIFFKRFNRKYIMFFMFFLFGALYVNKDIIKILLTGRYAVYSLDDGIIGLEQLIYHIPIVCILLYQWKIARHDTDFYKVNFCYALSSFFMGMSRYLLPAFGRVYILFLGISIGVGYAYKQIALKKNKYIFQVLIICYGLMRFLLYILQYYEADGIMPYITFWGWRL